MVYKIQLSIRREENRSSREKEKYTNIEKHYCREKKDNKLKEKMK